MMWKGSKGGVGQNNQLKIFYRKLYFLLIFLGVGGGSLVLFGTVYTNCSSMRSGTCLTCSGSTLASVTPSPSPGWGGGSALVVFSTTNHTFSSSLEEVFEVSGLCYLPPGVLQNYIEYTPGSDPFYRTRCDGGRFSMVIPRPNCGSSSCQRTYQFSIATSRLGTGYVTVQGPVVFLNQ